MNIVLVGLGSIGKRHLANLQTIWPCAKVWLVSASGRQFTSNEVMGCTQISLAQAIAIKPDFAVIASPAHLHLSHASAFSDAGIPALIEKPLSHDVHTAVEFRRTLKETDPMFSVGYCLRYLPSALYVKQLLNENKLGTVYLVQSVVGQHLSQWRRQTDFRNSVSAKKELGGGALLELSHELDYLLWLFGPMVAKYCHMTEQGELQLEVEESVDLVLQSNSSVICQVHLDFLQQVPQRRCVITGQQGRIEWDLIENSVLLINGQGRQEIYSEPAWDKNQMYRLMLQDFYTAVRNEKVAPVPLQEGIAVLELIEQARLLAVRGK